MILSSALIIWKSLILFTGSESPVVVVLRSVLQTRRPTQNKSRRRWAAMGLALAPGLTRPRPAPPPSPVRSGSMEPAFQRGDILFLNNWVRATPCGNPSHKCGSFEGHRTSSPLSRPPGPTHRGCFLRAPAAGCIIPRGRNSRVQAAGEALLPLYRVLSASLCRIYRHCTGTLPPV